MLVVIGSSMREDVIVSLERDYPRVRIVIWLGDAHSSNVLQAALEEFVGAHR